MHSNVMSNNTGIASQTNDIVYTSIKYWLQFYAVLSWVGRYIITYCFLESLSKQDHLTPNHHLPECRHHRKEA